MLFAMFILFGLLALGGAIAVIAARDPFFSAIALIVHFAALGGVYLTLESPFVAIAQVVVYAGAVVVMFLFVLAYLGDRRELDPLGGSARARWIAPIGLVLVAVLGATTIWAAFHPDTLLLKGEPVDAFFGGPYEIGEAFLTTYLLEFEATSVVLLVAVVGGIVLGLTGRARHQRLRELMQTRSSSQTRALTVKDKQGGDE